MVEMEEIRACIAGLSEINDLRNIFPNQIYRLIANLKLTTQEELEVFTEETLPLIYEMFADSKIKKDLFCLSLLVNTDPQVLSTFLKYEEVIFRIDNEDPSSLFDACIYKQRHWLLEVLDSETDYFTSSSDIVNVMKLLKIFDLSNQSHIELDHLENLTSSVETTDSFIEAYIDFVKHLLNTTKFIKKLNTEVDVSKVFNFLIRNDLLQTLSEYVVMAKSQDWGDIILRLKEKELFDSRHFQHLKETRPNYTQLEIFEGFTVMSALIKCLCLCENICNEPITGKDEITSTIERVREKLLLINNNALLIELLESIFCLSFLRHTHFTNAVKEEADDFFCKEPEMRLILSLLKSVFEEIRRKNRVTRDSAEFKRFLELNKYVSDATWRLEILTEIRNSNVSHLKRGFMYYMLSSPEALINLCLKANDEDKVHQVIQIFGLEEQDLSRDVNYTFKYAKLRRKLREAFKAKEKNEKIQELIKNHIKSCDTLKNEDRDEVILSLPSTDQQNLDIFDLFLTLPENHKDCEAVLSALEGKPTSKFSSEIMQIYHFDASVPQQIIASPTNPLNFESYKAQKIRYEKLAEIYSRFQKQINASEAGTLNLNHPSVNTVVQLEEICIAFEQAEEKEQVKYMTRLINYLKTFSRLFYIERNNSDLISKGKEVGVFEILNKSRTGLISELIYNRNLDGTDFDWVFSRLKLDLTYYIAAPSFPMINLNFTGFGEAEKRLLYKPKKDTINYVQKRNWLLAFILNKIHRNQDVKIDANEIRVKTLSNLIRLENTQKLKVWFDGNDVITVLQQNFTRQIADLNNKLSLGADEDYLRETDWLHLYELVMNLPEIEARKYESIKDDLLCNIIKLKVTPDYYKYISNISDSGLRVKLLMSELQHWPGDFCVQVIKSELTRFEGTEQEFQGTLENWRRKIELYNQLNALYPDDFWFSIEQKCVDNPTIVLQDILGTTNVDLLVSFIDVHEPTNGLLSYITANYLETLFVQNVPLKKIELLLDKLLSHHAIELCTSLLHRVRNLQNLEFVVQYLLKHASEDVAGLRNVRVSLKMMACFSEEEQEQHWSLIPEPLDIIEVLLMNTKLDKLGQLLIRIKPELKNREFSAEAIDCLLRKYAEKSLEFQLVAHQRMVRTPDNKIMLSLDSLNLERKAFAMPQSVPDKNDWVEDHEVAECMCCLQVTFSMFNRRHHCRRCGRVVCWNCSTKRMQVDSYGDISVRVCMDCYEQTSKPSGPPSSADVSGNSINDEYWLLTDDPQRNDIVRGEFSYENAPSVSLCLSILKYHSRTEDCPRFLLNQCENILMLLQPVSNDCSAEVDYNLIIKMLISLAVAAKVISNECMLQWGTSLADKILSQAELLGLLAERGCLNLIPKSSQSSSHYVDAAVLRRIRDKLLEQEQWNLALELSTKAGLDNIAVFAIWGKACLKAGNLHLARMKFQRCFDKTAYYEASEFSSVSELDVTPEVNRYRTPESKPYKNPPLLNEIIQIIESTTTTINKKLLKNFRATKDLYASTTSLGQSPGLSAYHEASICIVNKLRNLGAVAAGNYSFSENNSEKGMSIPHMENIFHDECVYYLSKYGTHLSLCQFHIKQGKFESALYNIIDNHLNFDIFIEVYMACLKDGLIDVLHENIIKIDSTFDIWKDYLRCLCIHLEKQSMFHSLYQLQLFMGDFVRAAMTCIKFYSDKVKTFEELSHRVEHLHKARDHLRQGLEQEQWVEVASVRRMSDSSQETFEEKALTNPELVMKMSSKEVDLHVNTIARQIELVQFLANCEKGGKSVATLVNDISCIPKEKKSTFKSDFTLPTLFGSVYEKMQLAILAIICGENIEDGFKFANRIIQAYKLKAVKIYCEVGRQLAKDKRHFAISQLVQCIHSSGGKNPIITEMCDDMLALAARTLSDNNATNGQIEDIIKYITDRTVKINSYIETKLLRSAFLVAAKFSKFSDIQRILREAELLNKPDVKKMCQKFLLTRAYPT